MGKFGTLSVLEDLADVNDPLSGNEAEIARRFAEALEIHNRLFDDMAGDLATTVTTHQLPFVGADTAIVQELDEWGRADASKGSTSGNLGFPLRLYGSTVQWTRTYLARATVADLAAQLDAHAAADIVNFRTLLRTVFFTNTNTASYLDRLDSKLTYTLRALLNADGQPLPMGPNGQTFDGSTHTHYLGSATYTAGATQTLIDTVVEHGVDGKVVVYIARADETTVRGFSGFAPYLDNRITVTGAAQIGSVSLDVNNPDNRAIGVFGGAEVWVKPWIPANYAVALDIGGSRKPLGIRVRSGSLTSGPGAFNKIDEHGHHPLTAQHFGREFGIAAFGREKAAVSRMNDASYAIPA
jgi:hypothetical protein